MAGSSTPTTVIPITSDDQFASIVASLPESTLQVLYFNAPWAKPCLQMSTVLDTLAATYPESTPPKIVFLSINAEELPDITEDHNVSAVPYIVLKRSSQILETVSGSDAARVRAAVEKHFGADPSATNGSNGAHQLPPAQQVTRPANQPIPEGPSNGVAASDPSQMQATAAAGTAKNMSAYAPTAKDTPAAQTANSESNEPKDLHTRLTQLTTAAPVMLFMKGVPSAPQCGFSRQLVSILRQNSVRYGFFNILADDEVRQGLKEFADWPTYPQLWMGGELVGGLDIVREELENDPEFFNEYTVDTSKAKAQNGDAPAAQAQAAST